MRRYGIIAALAVVSVLTLPATGEAKSRHHHHHHYYHSAHVKSAPTAKNEDRFGVGFFGWSPLASEGYKGGGATSTHPARAVESSGAHSGGIVAISTAAGTVRVALHLADRFKALIADFVSAGYHPRHMGGYASRGHVHNSRHYVGGAIDFDQRGWGKTVGFMYHAHAIIVRHGFRDGCDFGDCGHVDDAVHLGGRTRIAHRGGHHRYATLFQHRRVYMHARIHYKHHHRRYAH